MKKLFLLILVLLSFLFVSFKQTNSFYVLDEILEYDLIIDDNKDGSLDITYHIKWKVLNDTYDGPLSWVKIGTANRHIKNLSIVYDENGYSPIKNIEKLGGLSKSYVRIDFDREYYIDEVVDFTYSLTQEKIYTINDINDTIEYGFTPGWFDEIEIDKMTVKWKVPENESDIYYVSENNGKTEDGYILFEYSNLGAGEKVTVNISFIKSHFDNLKKSKSYISNEREDSLIVLLIIFGVIAIIVLIALAIRALVNSTSDGYDCYSGFTGRRYWYYSRHWRHHRYLYPGYKKNGEKLIPGRTIPQVVSGGSSFSGGHSCACACACACAGGGRAGCSRKDFYHTYLSIDDVISKLEDE